MTGTTARAAEKLANVTGEELYAITPAKSYTSANLDWHDKRLHIDSIPLFYQYRYNAEQQKPVEH